MAHHDPLQENLEGLARILATHPEYQEQLGRTKDVRSLAEALARLGEQHGLPLDVAALCALLERAAANRDVDDEELEMVAGGRGGGIPNGGLIVSLCTLGVGCAILSLGIALTGDKRTCGERLVNLK